MGSNELTTVEQVAAAILAGARFFSFHVPRANGTAGCRIAIELVYKWNTDANGHRYPSHVHGYSATYFSRHGYKEIGDGKSWGGVRHRDHNPAPPPAPLAPVILAAAVRAKGTVTVRRN
jgi:hypothetical protein